MMKKLIHFALVASVALVLASCGAGGGAHNHFDEITGDKSGLLRGTSMGDALESVTGRETTGDVEVGDDYIYVDVVWNDNEDYSVSYYFDDQGLYEVDVDAYLDSEGDAKALADGFKGHFNGKYGDAEEEDDYWIWSGSSSRGNDLEVSLSLDSDEYGSYVNVNFYELADGEY